MSQLLTFFFLYHAGKQARVANYDEPTQKRDNSPSQHGATKNTHSEAMFGANPATKPVQEGYSVQPGQDAANRAAQAGNMAAHHAEAAQGIPKSKAKRIDETNIAKLVAEENASKSKFPKYPGLERWELLEKMGDGAFSNVYRARDLERAHPDGVAIKVVRKYEMNSMQVSCF